MLEAVPYGWWYAAKLPGGRLAVSVASDPEIISANKRCVSHVCKVPGRSGGAPGPWSAGCYQSIGWDGSTRNFPWANA